MCVCVCVCLRERASVCMRRSIRVTATFDSLAPWCLNIMAFVLLAAGSVSHLLLSYIPMGIHCYSWSVQTESRANMLMQWREKELIFKSKKSVVTAECI